MQVAIYLVAVGPLVLLCSLAVYQQARTPPDQIGGRHESLIAVTVELVTNLQISSYVAARRT